MTLSASRTSGPISRRYAAPSSPSPAAVSATDRSSTATRPPSSGWASGAGGSISSTPNRARSRSRKNGDAVEVPWTVEQMSWTKPGSVSSPLRIPPPIVALASYTTHRSPGAGEGDRGGQPVGSGPDDDRVRRVSPHPRPSDPAAEPVAAMNREIGSDHASPEPRNQ